MVRNMADAEVSRLVTLNCADHGRLLAIALRNLFDSKRGTDFDLRWGDQSTRAHKVILELFLEPEAIATGRPKHKVPHAAKREVPDEENGIDSNILNTLLEFLYTGQVSVQEEQVESLLRVAKDLNFRLLVDSIVQPSDSKAADDCDGDGCSPTDEKSSRAGSPMYYSPHELCEPHIEDILNPGEEQDMESDPGCPIAELVKVELADVSEDELSESEERVMGSASSASLQYGSLKDDGGAPCDDSQDLEDGSSSSRMGVVDKDAASSGDGGVATKQLACPHCDFVTTKCSGYYSHLLSAHKITVRGRPAPKYKCSDCDYTSDRMESLRRHRKCLHPVKKPFACQQCSYVGHTKNSLEKHLYTAHGPDTKLFSCPHCEFVTSKYNGYYSHLLSAHKVTVRGQPAPTYKCSDCDYSTDRIDSLRRHQKSKHLTEKRYSCEHCSYVGSTNNSLVKHLYVAHDLMSSRFQCKTCGQCCGRKNDLKKHTLIHTNERPFKCTQCSFSSNAKRNLAYHVLNKH